MRCAICNETADTMGGAVLNQPPPVRPLCKTCEALHPVGCRGFGSIPIDEEEEDEPLTDWQLRGKGP